MPMLFRIGHGYDVHALAEGLPLVLGGVGIEHDKGCVAHSDGDVVIHALCDALLGAAALGDIGLHFPDTSDDYKGIDSKLLLHRVAELLAQKATASATSTARSGCSDPNCAPTSTGCAGRWPTSWESVSTAFQSRPPRPSGSASRAAKRASRSRP